MKINIHDIIAITCEGTCSTIHYNNELYKFTISKSLVQIERMLKNFECCIWLRIHRNSIVSLEKVETIDKRNSIAILQGGLKLNISVRQLPLVSKMIKKKLLIQ